MGDKLCGGEMRAGFSLKLRNEARRARVDIYGGSNTRDENESYRRPL